MTDAQWEAIRDWVIGKLEAEPEFWIEENEIGRLFGLDDGFYHEFRAIVMREEPPFWMHQFVTPRGPIRFRRKA